MNLKHLIKAQDLVDPSHAISSVARQASSVLLTKANKIGFLKVAAGEVGSVYCDASHDATLSSASIDYTSSGLVYGLSSSTHEIYVFRTSNLVANPEATDCVFEMKFPLRATPMLTAAKENNITLEMTMTAVKGGLLVAYSSDTEFGELVYYNTTTFSNQRQLSHPVFGQI